MLRASEQLVWTMNCVVFCSINKATVAWKSPTFRLILFLTVPTRRLCQTTGWPASRQMVRTVSFIATEPTSCHSDHWSRQARAECVTYSLTWRDRPDHAVKRCRHPERRIWWPSLTMITTMTCRGSTTEWECYMYQQQLQMLIGDVMLCLLHRYLYSPALIVMYQMQISNIPHWKMLFFKSFFISLFVTFTLANRISQNCHEWCRQTLEILENYASGFLRNCIFHQATF